MSKDNQQNYKLSMFCDKNLCIPGDVADIITPLVIDLGFSEPDKDGNLDFEMTFPSRDDAQMVAETLRGYGATKLSVYPVPYPLFPEGKPIQLINLTDEEILDNCTCKLYDWPEMECEQSYDLHDGKLMCNCCPYCAKQCRDDI